ncbi:hypothetical protein [Peptoniphilus harei]|uniref:hypothetical protein n=1 Tax=Peptoniphilus harei TaxID=54005 RepID=UPI00165211B1|nr:hypothetical protein [Peptoniphilus harei]
MRNKRFANFYKLIRENKSINFHKLMVGDKFMKSGRLINFYKLPINKRKNFDNDFLDI